MAKKPKVKTVKFYDTPPNPKYTICKSFEVPLYPYTLHIGVEDDLDRGCAVTYNFEDNVYIVIDREFKDDASIICHEAFHALEFISEYLGKGLIGEAGAYLIEWIVKTTVGVMAKEKPFKKKVKK